VDDHFWPTGTFLAMLTRQSRRKLLSLGIVRSIPANYRLTQQGGPGGSVWLLLDALVKVTARVENGCQTLLAIRVSGDVIGEMAVISGSSRSADVTACGRAVVCQIRGAVFVEFLHADTTASLALSRLAIERLRWANQRRLDFAGYETSVCLARVLLALAVRHGQRKPGGVNVGVPVTQSELGTLIGAKEGTVQKALRELATLRLVHPGHRTVTISDVAGLTAFADLPARSSAEIETVVSPNQH
jgi:CRP-like cAMP-binding protein